MCALVAGASFALIPAVAASATPTPSSVVCPETGAEAGGYTDLNVNTFTGGSITMTKSAAEIEGLTVAMADFIVDRDGENLVNVGRAGAGSQINPGAGELMLAVGGTLNNTNDGVHVGAGYAAGNGYKTPGKQGGDVSVGKSITNAPKLSVYGGDIQQGIGAAAVKNFAGFEGQLASLSARLGGFKDTGATSASGSSVTFSGSGSAELQVFSIDAKSLKSEIYLNKIPAGANVLINVSGASASFAPTHFELNGVRSDFGAELSKAAPRVMWNFTDATSVRIGGSTQFVGSILIPNADSELSISASGNGRVYVGGDLVMNGSGNELHSYPWNGDVLTTCKPELPPVVTPTPKPTTPPVTPTEQPTPKPTTPPTTPPVTPTEQPTEKPTTEPTPVPSVKPTETPVVPTVPPTPKPTETPAPSATPTPTPTQGVLDDEVTATPTPPAGTSTPPAGGTGAAAASTPLAQTGVDGVTGIVTGGVIALLLGAALLFVRRRTMAKPE